MASNFGDVRGSFSYTYVHCDVNLGSVLSRKTWADYDVISQS